MNRLNCDPLNPYEISELEMVDLLQQLEGQVAYQKVQRFQLTEGQVEELAKFLGEVDAEIMSRRDAIKDAAVRRMTWQLEDELRTKLVPEISKKLTDDIEGALREKLELIDQIDLRVLRSLAESTEILRKTIKR